MNSRSQAIVELDVPLTLSDGTRLAADIWRPAHGRPAPVLLQRLPYDKRSSLSATLIAGLEPTRAVEAGYVVIIQDTRGRFASDGEFVPFLGEAADSAETIRWAAGLPYCDGHVGMYGASYFGANQLLAAATGIEPLCAIAPQMTSGDFHDGWTYVGGAMQLGFVLYWAMAFLAPVALERRARAGLDVHDDRALLGEMLRSPHEVFAHLPTSDHPLLAKLVPGFNDWFTHERADDWWRSRAAEPGFTRVRVPALHIGGWYDLFLHGTLAAYRGLRERAADERARDKQELLIGPWAHAVTYDALGELEFGPTASQLVLDMTGVHLAWFDRHLRPQDDTPAGCQPRVRVFVMGANRWRDADDWPLPGARPAKLFLSSGPTPRSGRLTWEPPPDTAPEVFTADPLNPVPTVGGATYLPGVLVGKNAGPRSQTPLDDRRDILSYLSEPLDEDVELVGPLTLRLVVATTGRDGDFVAKLIDRHMDGTGVLVADGILRLRFRDGSRIDRPVEPATRYTIDVDLLGTAYLFRRLHRFRIDICGSNFPRFDRNPNTGFSPSQTGSHGFQVAHQTVFHGDAGSFLRFDRIAG